MVRDKQEQEIFKFHFFFFFSETNFHERIWLTASHQYFSAHKVTSCRLVASNGAHVH